MNTFQFLGGIRLRLFSRIQKYKFCCYEKSGVSMVDFIGTLGVLLPKLWLSQIKDWIFRLVLMNLLLSRTASKKFSFLSNSVMSWSQLRMTILWMFPLAIVIISGCHCETSGHWCNQGMLQWSIWKWFHYHYCRSSVSKYIVVREFSRTVHNTK